MNAREFFYLVSRMRKAQQDYFNSRESYLLRVCKALEREVDEEIARVNNVLSAR